MATSLPPGSTDFLDLPPLPVTRQAAGVAGGAADRLPQAVIDKVMGIPGVDGVWIERDAAGQRVVVLHYTPRGSRAHLPATVAGLPTRIVGGEPIRAL
ncbi:MAG: hypothetical protein JSS19_04830 [Proteobacteria bacterium]|nr:hypothetical protein [Pseudomonadota bacterium]MBS0608664.1 hypothetical protein [Pseudomonadota bacterium]